MTPEERDEPKLINGSRRLRIARGSGTNTAEVNALLKQFSMMRKMMKDMTGAKGKKGLKALQNLGGQIPAPGR